MAKLFFLFLFAAFCVLGLQPDQTEKVVVFAGRNVTLNCSSGVINIKEGIGVFWNRSDVKQDKYVLFYRDNQPDTDRQDPRYKKRVELAHPNSLNDLSLIIQNVSVKDSGDYECKLIQDPHMFNAPPIKTIQVIVTERSTEYHGLVNKNPYHGPTTAMIVLLAVALSVFIL